MFDTFKFTWLWFHPIGAHMHTATRFSLVTFSYGHWIPPQGEVQPDRSSYDNIIVRNVKGQTAARLVLRGLCWENHRWLQHCCKANTLQSALGNGRNASEDLLSLLSHFFPRLSATRSCSVSCWKTSRCWIRACLSLARPQKCLGQQNLLRARCLRHSRSISE